MLSDTIVNTADLSDIEPPECEFPPNEIGALFEGVGFASVRALLRRKNTLKEIQPEIDRYHADPRAFEAEVAAWIP